MEHEIEMIKQTQTAFNNALQAITDKYKVRIYIDVTDHLIDESPYTHMEVHTTVLKKVL